MATKVLGDLKEGFISKEQTKHEFQIGTGNAGTFSILVAGIMMGIMIGLVLVGVLAYTYIG